MPSTNGSQIVIKATTEISYKLIYGTFIHTPDLNTLEINISTLIGINENGKIEFIIKNFESDPIEYFKSTYPTISNFEFIDYSKQFNKFFIPGFIDTHIHASQYPNIGIGLNTPLLNWLNDYTFPLESNFSKDLKLANDVYEKVILKTLNNGTTCGSYFTTIDLKTSELFTNLLLKYGQRGFVGKVCMDHNEPYPTYQESLQDCIKSMNDLIEYIENLNPQDETLVKPIITPRFAPVCSREMLKELGKLSEIKNLPIQTHISENEKEIELVSKVFPDCETYASVYDKYGLLTNKTILAHGIHLTQSEIELIKERDCSISHCPTSNTFISSGEAPIYKYLYNDGLNVSLGTDVSGGFESSILQIIKHSILTSHHLSMHNQQQVKISIKDAIYMATMGGAKAVNLQNEIGSFEVNKKFDSQLIDLMSNQSSVDIFDWQLPLETDSMETKTKKIGDLLSKWVLPVMIEIVQKFGVMVD